MRPSKTTIASALLTISSLSAPVAAQVGASGGMSVPGLDTDTGPGAPGSMGPIGGGGPGGAPGGGPGGLGSLQDWMPPPGYPPEASAMQSRLYTFFTSLQAQPQFTSVRQLMASAMPASVRAEMATVQGPPPMIETMAWFQSLPGDVKSYVSSMDGALSSIAGPAPTGGAGGAAGAGSSAAGSSASAPASASASKTGGGNKAAASSSASSSASAKNSTSSKNAAGPVATPLAGGVGGMVVGVMGAVLGAAALL